MTETPTTFRVAFRKTNRMIVGIEPTGDLGTKFDVATLDSSEYANATTFDPAYLSADGEHIVAEQPA